MPSTKKKTNTEKKNIFRTTTLDTEKIKMLYYEQPFRQII